MSGSTGVKVHTLIVSYKSIELANGGLGITIHDVHFMGRSAFYRLSLSEMFVPYGDPRNPIYRKGAFDLGNVGAGVTANNLARKYTYLTRSSNRAKYNYSWLRLPWSNQVSEWLVRRQRRNCR